MSRRGPWNVSVAIVGMVCVAAIVIAGLLTGHNSTLAATGLTAIGAGIGYAIKNGGKP